MRWDFGWHHQEKRKVNVYEALKLRDNGTLKTGDLYCCSNCVGQEFGVRLHPVDAIVRSKFLRRDPRYNENTVRSDCIKQKESRQKGESWKHTRVLDAIEFMFENESLLMEIGFTGFERLGRKGGVDFDLFDENGNKSKMIVVLRNLRRARSIKRLDSDVRILYIHRWREADVDFVSYIRERVKQTFEMNTNNDDFLEHINNTFSIPCIGLRPERSRTNPMVGRGMVVNLTPEFEEESFQAEQLEAIESLIERVQEHNMWAISNPGEHSFDTKYLSFQTFSGIGTHPDKAVDAILCAISDNLNQPGIKFHQYPNQAKLIREVAEDEKVVNDHASNVIEGLKAENIEIPSQEELHDYLMRNFVDTAIKEAEVIESGQSTFEVVKKDALSWVESNAVKKMMKMLREETLRFNSKKEIELKVDEKWFLMPHNDEKSSAYDIQFNAAVLDAPQLLARWDTLSEDSRKNCLKALKKRYKEMTYVAGIPLNLTPLVDIKLGHYPKVLTDPYGLVSKIVEVSNQDQFEFTPLTSDELGRLCFYLSADKIISTQHPKHPSFLDLMWAANASTEHLQRTVNLKLPQPIEDLLEGRNDAGMEILDLMAQILKNQNDSEE